jgi:hypothetical protein
MMLPMSKRKAREKASGVTIKVSTSLYSAAKEGAERSHRSVPKQVEYWTDLGRVIDEAGVSKNDLMQAANALRLRVRNAPSRATELFRGLVNFFELPPRGAEAEFSALIESSRGPVYGTSPSYPGKIIQKLADGTEIVGSFQDGSFAPEYVVRAEPQPHAAAGR